MFLAYLAFGLLAIAAGFFMFIFGLFGRIPGFKGNSRMVAQNAATYWKGRLAILIGGPIMVAVGCMIIAEPFSKKPKQNFSQKSEQRPVIVRSEEEKRQDREQLRKTLSGVTWESRNNAPDGGKLINVTFEFGKEVVKGTWDIQRRGQKDPNFSECRIEGSLLHDGEEASVAGLLECKWKGTPSMGNFRVFLNKDKSPHMVHRWSIERIYEFDLILSKQGNQ